MTFQDLLRTGSLNAEERQRSAAASFPDLVRSHGMRLWQPGEPYSLIGVRYLLGVGASYSLDDLQLMDEIDSQIRAGRLDGMYIDVFDVLTIPTMEEFNKYIPGIVPVYQTPVLGIWRDGVLVERLKGLAARLRILSI